MLKSKGKISSNDKKILDALMENARQSLIEISEKTGMSRQTVQKTINRLEKNNIIWGYCPVVDLNKIGKKRFVMLVKSTQTLTREQTVNSIAQIRKMIDEEKIGELVYSGYYNGRFDWIINFYTKDIVQAKKILREWKLSFEDFIDEIYLLEELLTTRECKITNPDYEQAMAEIL